MSTSTPNPVPTDPPSSYRAIENLIATYAELVDDGDFAGVGTLLADATFTGGAGTVSGRDAIEKMLRDSKKPEDQPSVKMVFEKGENVTIKEGPFQGYEGTVDELLPDKGLVRVLVTIFGRQAPIELEEWQIGKAEGE